MKVSEVVKLLNNLPQDKDVCFYDKYSKLEFNVDRVTYKPTIDKVHVEEVMK